MSAALTFVLATSSTAVSSAPPSGEAAGDDEAELFCTAVDGPATVWSAVSCANAGSARTSAADAIRVGLMRIAPLLHGSFDRVSRPLPGQCREEEKNADQQDGDDDEQ